MWVPCPCGLKKILLKLVEDFHWNWKNFDKGLKCILKNHASEMISIKVNSKLEIKLLKEKYEVWSKNQIKYRFFKLP